MTWINSNITYPLGRALTLLFIWAVFASPNLLAQTSDADEYWRKVKMGVVKVLPTKPQGVDDEVGAAVVVGGLAEDIYFVTAYHVIEDATSIAIETFGKRGKRFTVSTFDDRYDPDTDIAVLVAPRYQVRKFVEQLYETDLAGISSNSEMFLLGHPSREDWHFSSAVVDALTPNRVFLRRDVVEPRFSGGPMMNQWGDLMGIVTGIAPDGRGEVVRIDVVLDVLDRWGVAYETKLRVDFCNVINQVVLASLSNFDSWKGARNQDDMGSFWTLKDRSLDITGTGRSMFVGDYQGKRNTVYVADFGRQMDGRKAEELRGKIARQIASCLPKKKKIRQEGSCFVTSYRKSMWRTPIEFVTNLTRGDEVELYMHRGYNVPSYGLKRSCDAGGNYLLRTHWPSEW